MRQEPAAGASDGKRPAPLAGARWQPVALPPEHGSWGLVGEPVVLGLLVAPAWASLLARAAWGLSRHRRPATARAVGFGEVAWAVVTVLLVAAGFWS